MFQVAQKPHQERGSRSQHFVSGRTPWGPIVRRTNEKEKTLRQSYHNKATLLALQPERRHLSYRAVRAFLITSLVLNAAVTIALIAAMAAGGAAPTFQ